MRRRVRTIQRVARAVAMAFLVVVPVAVLVLWMMFQHKPLWYDVPDLDESGKRQARAESAELIDHISRKVVKRQAVRVTLDDGQLNRWLTVLNGVGGRSQLPEEMDRWVVSFTPFEMRVGAYYDNGTWRAILNAGLTARLSDDGQTLFIALNDIRGGSLAVPDWGLQQVLDSLRGTVKALHDVHTVNQLRGGIALRNRFIWPNGKRPIRIDRIEFSDGKLDLTLEPL